MTDQELDLIHARIKSCTHLRLARFAQHLTRLCLRQNFITVLEETDFGPLHKLQELDLYDNKIKSLGDALAGKSELRSVPLHV
jgi:protein phosphatase 1 regulatory subunit 7